MTDLVGRGFFHALFEGEDLWHHRRSLGKVKGGNAIVSPDGDVYIEMTKDYADWAPGGPNGGAAARLVRASRYDFAADDRAAGSEFMIEAERQAEAVLAEHRALPVETKGSASVALPVEPGSFWCYGETVTNHDLGTKMEGDLPETAVLFNEDHAMISVGDEVVHMRRFSTAKALETWVAGLHGLPAPTTESWENDDIRTLPVRFRDDGERDTPFSDSVAKMYESPFETFPVEGPRTCLWYLRGILKTGGGPIARHTKWKVESEISSGDRSVHEHAVISRCLEYASCYDSLNLPNLAWAEALVRRAQLIEEAHVDNPSAPNYEGGHHYTGHGERRGGALVCPRLREHVAHKMRDESSILKEKRKANEARTLKPTPKGAGKGGVKAEGE